MLSTASLLALLASSSSLVLAAPSLSVSFAGAAVVEDVDNFKVTAHLKNTGDETLKLLNDPNTVLTPKWATKAFDISSSAGVPKFKGVAVKWSPTAAAESKSYTTIAPGATVSFEHALGGVYNFTSTGSYEVVPRVDATTFTHVNEAGELVSVRADVASGHEAKLVGSVVPRSGYVSDVASRSTSAMGKRAHSFNGCSSSEQTKLNTAAVNAQTYADSAYTYLTGISASTTRYTTWFGTYTSTRKTLVQTHYSNIRNGQLATDGFDCTCTDSDTYAYVYPDEFGTIYLCGYYWNAPATGTDSQAGTLIHESSHFTKNGGTEDYVYGQTSAKSLAKSNPSEATMNADNHEYFAENNPALS